MGLLCGRVFSFQEQAIPGSAIMCRLKWHPATLQLLLGSYTAGNLRPNATMMAGQGVFFMVFGCRLDVFSRLDPTYSRVSVLIVAIAVPLDMDVTQTFVVRAC